MTNKRKSEFLIMAPFIAFIAYWLSTRGMAGVAALSNNGDNVFTAELFIHWFSFFILGVLCNIPMLILNDKNHSLNKHLMFLGLFCVTIFIALYYARYKMQIGISFSVSLLFASGIIFVAAFASSRDAKSKKKHFVFYLVVTAFLLLSEMTIKLMVQNSFNNPQILSFVNVVGFFANLSFVFLGIISCSMLEENNLEIHGFRFLSFAALTASIDILFLYRLFVPSWFIVPGDSFSYINQFFAIYAGARNIIFFFAGSYSVLLLDLLSNARHKQ